MKTTMAKAIGAALLGMTLFCNHAAWAGYLSSSGEVYIGSNFASGAMNAVRYSSDWKQYIGCRGRGYSSGSFYISCGARDKNGKYGSCSTYDINLLESLKTLSPSSSITFEWNSSGKCQVIDIDNRSYFLR